MAGLVQLPGWDDPNQDIQLVVKNWFECHASGDWVLVLDNADNVLDFFPETKGSVSIGGTMKIDGLAKFIPQGTKGIVIATTRDYAVADILAGRNTLSKQELSPAEAVQLFKQHYPAATEDECKYDGSISLLLKELQYLPLAIVQVAAFLRQNRLLSPYEYLQRFNSTRDSQKRLLSKPFNDLRRDANTETILTTFSITFQQIQEQSPLAGSLLKLIACVDRQGIPHDLLARSGLEGCDDDFTLCEAISKLVNFSLITASTVVEYDRAYEMHALVYVSIEACLSTQEMNMIGQRTAKALASILPNGEHENWSVWRLYLPHASALTKHIQAESLDAATISFGMSGYFLSSGHYYEAEAVAQSCIQIRVALLGQEHSDTLRSIANLASTFRNQGRWKEAEELEVQVLETRKRVLGLKHPDTLSSIANLASTFRNQGRWKEAENLEVQVMETRTRVLGLEHPDTLSSIANLASTFRNQGRWKEAEELEVQVMETSKRVLGLEHPHTLSIIANLASTFWNQGRWKEAEELEVQVMETSKRVLGMDHPDTLNAMHNLGYTRKSQGRIDEAIAIMVEAATLSARAIGEHHPFTKDTINTLQRWRHETFRISS